MENFLQGNVPLRHLLNAKPPFMYWLRSAFNEVNDWTLILMHIAFQNCRKESLKESIQLRYKLVVGFFTNVYFLCCLYTVFVKQLYKKKTIYQPITWIQKANCEKKKLMQKTHRITADLWMWKLYKIKKKCKKNVCVVYIIDNYTLQFYQYFKILLISIFLILFWNNIDILIYSNVKYFFNNGKLKDQAVQDWYDMIKNFNPIIFKMGNFHRYT